MSYSVYSKIRRILCVSVSFLIILSLFGCSSSSVRSIKLTDTREPEPVRKFHSLSAKSEVLYESDSHSFVFDSENFAVSVNDKKTHQSFDSLCIAENAYACSAEMTVAYGGIMYTLNTQDNSAAFGTASWEKTENGITVTYGIKADNDGDVLVSLKMDYEFSASSMKVTAGTSVNKNAVLLTLDILPYFGYQSSPSTQDYFLVPDGCGALMYTSLSDGITDNVEIPVYGSNSEFEKAHSICPVYGIRTGASAVCAVISEGAAVSSVRAVRKTDGTDVSHIYAGFEITSGSISGTRLKTAQPYGGKIAVSYIFLSGSSADYSGMASSAREYLIGSGILPSSAVHTGGVRFNLVIPGYMKTPSGDKLYVTFDDAQSLIGILKGKSVNDINLIYKGIFDGGINQKKPSSLNVLSQLGGSKGLEELYSHTNANNVSLIVSLNAAKSFPSVPASSGAARNVNGKRITSSENGSKNGVFQSVDKTQSSVSAILRASDNLAFDGICIEDIAGTVYPDCGGKAYTREDTATVFSSIMNTLGNTSEMFVSTGNFYSLKNACFITDIPMSVTAGESASYESVPFVQMILHGCIPYSAGAVNLQSGMKTYMLKCIEYGCMPCFEWTFTQGDSMYYAYTVSEAVDFYTGMKNTLDDLADISVSSREKTADGVYAVRYDNGASVYVNYNDYPVTTPDNITVSAMDYLRIG